MRALSRPGIIKTCDFLGWYSLQCFIGDSEREIDSLLILDESLEEEEEGRSLLLPEDRLSEEIE
jgi:hypothetical protein